MKLLVTFQDRLHLWILSLWFKRHLNLALRSGVRISSKLNAAIALDMFLNAQPHTKRKSALVLLTLVVIAGERAKNIKTGGLKKC